MAWNGTPAIRPEADELKLRQLEDLTGLPFVITCAMPRPAMNRTRVAMIGWMRKACDQAAVEPRRACPPRGTEKHEGERDGEPAGGSREGA